MSTGKKVFVCLRLCLIILALLTNTIIAPAQKVINNNSIKSRITAAYKQYFGLDIPFPAYVGGRSDDMGRYWTSTAYRGSTRYRLYLLTDGTVLPFAGPAKVPYGTYRVAVVAIDHGNTNIATLLNNLWVEVQAEMNRNYAAYAYSCGNDRPMVQFVNTNFLASNIEIANPRSSVDIISYVEGRGFAKEDFDVYVALDMNAQSPSGGSAEYGGDFIYMGFYYAPTAFADLSQLSSYNKPILFSLGKAIYDHEFGHIFGWEHEWVGDSGGKRRPDDPITNPALYGWTDTDGNGCPEIMNTVQN